MKKIAIIGNGISGITAARHIRKLDSEAKITVISGETDYFFSRTALMYVYMGHLKFEHTQPYENWFWEKNRIDLIKTWVEKVDFEGKTLKFSNEGSLSYDSLIIATGSKSNKFGWKGQDLIGVQGLYSYQDLENLQNLTPSIKKGVIIGGGLIGIELAEMLHSRKIEVSFLVRESSFWNNILPKEESELINRHILENHIDLRFSTELDEIIGDENGRVKAIRTKSGEVIDCQFVGLTVGVSPNIELLKSSSSIGEGVGVRFNRGILVNEFLETNIPNIYAIGDCAEHKNPPKDRRSIEQIWYTGRIMGETVAQTICGKPTKYNPGIFFNSAKFFEIEYQTYGQVLAQKNEKTKSFYWEDSSGRKCVRINYDSDNQVVSGVNSFGIRMRHEIWDKWLKEERKIDFVLENLKAANFDPEFFKQFEDEILEKYNQENNASLKIKRRKGIFSKLSF